VRWSMAAGRCTASRWCAVTVVRRPGRRVRASPRRVAGRRGSVGRMRRTTGASRATEVQVADRRGIRARFAQYAVSALRQQGRFSQIHRHGPARRPGDVRAFKYMTDRETQIGERGVFECLNAALDTRQPSGPWTDQPALSCAPTPWQRRHGQPHDDAVRLATFNRAISTEW
jgi:hypothetical protein